MTQRASVTSVTWWDGLTRQLCRFPVLPRRFRFALARRLVGDESSCSARQFRVRSFGIWYAGSLDSHIDWQVYFLGAYDPIGIRMLISVAKQIDGPVLWDVGANTGSIALVLARYCRHVYCFEPCPRVFEQLTDNLGHNKVDNVSLLSEGLSDHSGAVPFFPGRGGNEGAGSFENHAEGERDSEQILNCRTGDEVVGSGDCLAPQIVKIDVEGHEANVLRGMREVLRNHRPLIVLEHRSVLAGGTVDYQALLPNDYHLFQIVASDRWVRAHPKVIEFANPRDYDLLAVPAELMSGKTQSGPGLSLVGGASSRGGLS